jgi:hypothetical protein
MRECGICHVPLEPNGGVKINAFRYYGHTGESSLDARVRVCDRCYERVFSKYLIKANRFSKEGDNR